MKVIKKVLPWVLVAANLLNPLAFTAKALAGEGAFAKGAATAQMAKKDAYKYQVSKAIAALPDELSNKGEIWDVFMKTMSYEKRREAALAKCFANEEGDPVIALWKEFTLKMQKEKLNPLTVIEATNLFFNSIGFYQHKANLPERQGEEWQKTLDEFLKDRGGECDDFGLAKAETLKAIFSVYGEDKPKVEVHSGWGWEGKDYMGPHAFLVVKIREGGKDISYAAEITLTVKQTLDGEKIPGWRTRHGGIEEAQEHKSGKGKFSPYSFDTNVIYSIGEGAKGFKFFPYKRNETASQNTDITKGKIVVEIPVPGGSIDFDLRQTDSAEFILGILNLARNLNREGQAAFDAKSARPADPAVKADVSQYKNG